jgi:hypothetical protein
LLELIIGPPPFRPYFGFLLLVGKERLLAQMPPNCNWCLRRLVELHSASYSFARYAAELDVPLEEVYRLAHHLVHWAKIKVVYPITETNVYVVQPSAPIHM